MLPKKNRIPREIFDPLWKSGKRLASPLFSFQYVPSPNADSRFSAVVSKKVAKTAVQRNSIRRKVYNSLKNIIPLIKKPIHATFHVKTAILQASLAEIEKETKDLLQKAGSL